MKFVQDLCKGGSLTLNLAMQQTILLKKGSLDREVLELFTRGLLCESNTEVVVKKVSK